MKTFRCPHCGEQHLMVVDRCPSTEAGISEVYKLQGELLAERYRLGSIISEGGMGVVYEAEHVTLGRRVAVKMLHPHLRVSAETMLRFENEARLAASVGHRSVVDVIDLGRYQGLPYFVMEYLDGESLGDVLERRGVLEIPEAVDLCIELLEGLRAVHERGIVHRDLKPGNIMLVKQAGGSPILKVLDFGISRLQEADEQGLSITKTGSVFGTPRYMSPEQAKGKKDIDARADLYAVGVVLYRCLTGGFPFTGDNYNALLNAIATSDPVPPRDRVDGIPDGLEAIILKSLARVRTDRYQDANSFIESLAPYASFSPHMSASQKTVKAKRVDRPTFEPPAPVSVDPKSGGTATSWTSTSGKRWRGELTWVLPVAIVTVLVVSGLAALAFFMHSRLARQEQDIERMSRVIGSKKRVDSLIPARPASASPDGSTQDEDRSSADPARVRLELTGLPDDATVELDGRPLPQIPILLEPDTGSHVLEVKSAGYEDWEKDIALTADLLIEVVLIPLPAPQTQPVTPMKKVKKGVDQPPIDTSYPGMVGKKKSG